MTVKFDATSNTPSDYLKGVAAAVAAAAPLLTASLSDGHFSAVEVVSVVTGTVLAFLGALGLYSSKDEKTDETPPETPDVELPVTDPAS